MLPFYSVSKAVNNVIMSKMEQVGFYVPMSVRKYVDKIFVIQDGLHSANLVFSYENDDLHISEDIYHKMNHAEFMLYSSDAYNIELHFERGNLSVNVDLYAQLKKEIE